VKVQYTFRCYPTDEQQAFLAKQFGVIRYAYNWALRLRSEAFRDGKKIGYHESSAAWTKHRNELDWAREVSCVPCQQALRHLQMAYKNFFEKRSGYPAFKKRRHKQSAQYTRSAFSYDRSTRTLKLAKLGRIKVRWSRRFQSEPTTATITKSPSGRYHVCLVLDEPAPEPFPKTGQSVGVDMGVCRLATLSNGERIANPKHLGRNLDKLRREQRKLSRRKKGSGRWERQRVRVARIQEHIAACRKDHLDKVSLDLVRRFDLIVIEDLHVRGMVRNSRLARSLSDSGLGLFRGMIEYKVAWYGKESVATDRFFPSSKTCSACGFVVESLPLHVRAWDCPECGAHHDRDENAAKNILAVGHTESQNARGGGGRPARAKAREGGPRRSVNQPVKRCSHRSPGIRSL